jgi:uncharacterized protein YcbX
MNAGKSAPMRQSFALSLSSVATFLVLLVSSSGASSQTQPVHVWADGLYVKTGLEDTKAALLGMIGRSLQLRLQTARAAQLK